MKRTDIERMISLADDRYIDEIFQDKITGRRRNIFVTFTAVAAALALTAGGIGYLVSTAGNADKITVDDPIISEVGAVDYSLYFQNKTGGVSDGYVSVRGYNDLSYVVTDISELDGILPFDTEDIFSITADVLCSSRNNDVPYAADIRFSYNDFSKVNIIACKQGGLSNLDIENAVPVKLGDVDVYGFDVTEKYSAENNYDICLEAYFVSNGTEYIVSGKNVSHSKLGSIIYGIIYNGISPKSIDISNARLDYVYRSEDVSIEEANLLEPFEGLVPQPLDGFVLYRGVTCTYRETGRSSELYSLAVTFADVPNLPNTRCNKSIQLYYSTEYKIADFYINIYDLIPLVIEPLFRDGNDSNGGKFTVDFGNFLVEIQAENCSTDEVWAYIEAIKSNMRGEEISPAEANNIAPYTGFVPQVEKVGNMTLGSVQYNGRDIALNYSGSGGSISLNYTVDENVPSHYSVITIEQLIEPDIVFERSDSDDGRHNYTFAVDCKGMYGRFYVCIDSEKCTTAELYDCILTLLMERGQNYPVSESVTLAEAKDVEPFGVYVPTRESGVLKLEKGILNYHNENGNKEPLSLHFTFSDSDTGDSLVFAYQKDTVDFSEMPAETIIPIENIDWTTVNNFVKTKTTFLIDCGKVKLLVDADCTIDQVWYYIDQIKRAAMFDAAQKDGKLITMDKVKELAKKGDDLTWSDFESYYGVDVGSGLYIMAYSIEGTYCSVSVGGVPTEKPWYIYLNDGNGNHIDIRYDSIDDFLN